MKIKLSHYQEDKVVRKSLRWAISNFVADRERVIEQGKGFVFSIDPKEDVLMLTKHIDAMTLVHDYYSKESQRINTQE